MATIIENLKKILEARYGKDVRQAIHDSIENCYNDGKAGSIDLQARQMLGDTNISSIADGTVTGSVKTLSDKATANEEAISEVNNKLGNTDISAIGDGTVTGGLDALNSKLGNTDISAIGDGTLTGGLDALNSKLGNTDISAIGDGTVTGGLDALNSNLQKQVIITQSITIETTIEPYKMIVSRFCIRPLIPYVLLSAIHPSSGTKTQFFLNDSGDLCATAEGVQSVGDWVINGSYIAK